MGLMEKNLQILLTNDDGFFAPGLAEMLKELQQMGPVEVVAPQSEQSGVGHAITYLRPLQCHEVEGWGEVRGWGVDGTPADCVKLAATELCKVRPTLVVSGINHGLNAGLNVLYSGTVAAAVEAAFFGITSVAVSLEYEAKPNYREAAKIARVLIEQVADDNGTDADVYNINIPTAATEGPASVAVVPMGTSRFEQAYEERKDPKGRTYYWASALPKLPAQEEETDVAALRRGCVTLTPLKFDLTHEQAIERMKAREWTLNRPAQTQ